MSPPTFYFIPDVLAYAYRRSSKLLLSGTVFDGFRRIREFHVRCDRFHGQRRRRDYHRHRRWLSPLGPVRDRYGRVNKRRRDNYRRPAARRIAIIFTRQNTIGGIFFFCFLHVLS